MGTEMEMEICRALTEISTQTVTLVGGMETKLEIEIKTESIEFSMETEIKEVETEMIME